MPSHLAERMAQKSPTADVEARFTAILEAYGRFLRNVIVQHCPKDAGIQFDDIEQDARLRLWRAVQSEREIRQLASYISRVATTATIDAVRRVKARQEDQLSNADPTESELLVGVSHDRPDHVLERQRVAEQVEAALAALPANRQRAVRLYLQGLSSQEIASLVGWSEPKARNLLYRGLKVLRERLNAQGIECEVD